MKQMKNETNKLTKTLILMRWLYKWETPMVYKWGLEYNGRMYPDNRTVSIGDLIRI